MKRCTQCRGTYVSAEWRCPDCGLEPACIDGLPAFSPESAVTTSGFRPEQFSDLADLESGNFWFRARNRLIIWALRRCFPKMQRYLEIGCGTGFVLEGVAKSFPNVELTGSEILSAGLPFAAKRVDSAQLLQMDARNIPYQDEFDVIGAFDVLEHIEEDEKVLCEIHRALVEGGRGGAIFTVPQHSWMWSNADEDACHVRRYSSGELRAKLVQAGFRIELETSFVSLLLPAMFASRLSKKKQSANNVGAELRLPLVLNTVFAAIMSIELGLISVGFRFPWGGSGLIVARKEG